LIEYLVSSKKIIQDFGTSIYDSAYYYIQNPLSLKRWHYQQVGSAMEFEEKENFKIIIGDKKVPFVHYQSTFSAYAALYCFLNDLHLHPILIKRILKFQIVETDFRVSLLYRIIMKFQMMKVGKSRQETIRKLMDKRHTDEACYLTNLLNFLLKTS
jgi:hypothetical protein